MKPSKSRGAALLLALWALFLLAALVMSWALNIDSRFKISGSENRIFEAQAMAASGAEVAMVPTIKPNSPNLARQVWAPPKLQCSHHGRRRASKYQLAGGRRKSGAD